MESVKIVLSSYNFHEDDSNDNKEKIAIAQELLSQYENGIENETESECEVLRGFYYWLQNKLECNDR